MILKEQIAEMRLLSEVRQVNSNEATAKQSVTTLELALNAFNIDEVSS